MAKFREVRLNNLIIFRRQLEIVESAIFSNAEEAANR